MPRRPAGVKSELMATIRMYTTRWCADCRRAKRFLDQRAIPFEEINIDEEAGAAELVAANNGGKYKVPTFDVDGRYFACSPYDPEILRRELNLAD